MDFFCHILSVITGETSVATSIAYGPILTKVIEKLSAAFDIKKEVSHEFIQEFLIHVGV